MQQHSRPSSLKNNIWSGMTSPYDQIVEQYDELFGLDNPYYGPITVRERELFDSYVPPAKKGDLALDIGCGTGLHTQWLVEKGYSAVGVDISCQMLKVAKRKSRSWKSSPVFIQADALTLARSNIANSSFQVVLCLGSTLNHIHDWERLANVVSNLLTPGGIFLFSCDTLLDIDSLSWLVPGEISSLRTDSFNRFLRIVKSLIRRRMFQNHWTIVTEKGTVEIPLTYEPICQYSEQLGKSKLEVVALSGVHLFSRLSRSVILASNVHFVLVPEKKNRMLARFLKGIDNILSKFVPSLSANVVGVVKRRVQK